MYRTSIFMIVTTVFSSHANFTDIIEYFPDIKAAWPILEEREWLDSDEVNEIRVMWDHAKDSGLFIDRKKVWEKLSTYDRKQYNSSFLRYRNSELIEIVNEMYVRELECFEKYRFAVLPVNQQIKIASCMEEYILTLIADEGLQIDEVDLSDFGEGVWLYYEEINGVALSTLSPDLFEYAVRFSGASGYAEEEYFSRIGVEDHLLLILDGEWDYKSRVVRYSISNVKRVLSLIRIDLLPRMLHNYPDLTLRHSNKLKGFIEKLRISETNAEFGLDNTIVRRFNLQADRLENLIQQISSFRDSCSEQFDN